jgi:hypothetical protein
VKINWIRSLNYFTFNLEIFSVIEIIFNLHIHVSINYNPHILPKKLYFPIIGLAKPREREREEKKQKMKERKKRRKIIIIIYFLW